MLNSTVAVGHYLANKYCSYTQQARVPPRIDPFSNFSIIINLDEALQTFKLAIPAIQGIIFSSALFSGL